MPGKEIFTKLGKILDSVTRGDYAVGKDIERLLDKNTFPADVVTFAESLNTMTIKLEAREMALENAIANLKKKNAELDASIKKRAFFSTIFTSIFLGLSVFVFVLVIIQNTSGYADYMARFVEVLFLIINVFIIKKSGLSFADFGLTRRGAKKAVAESLGFSTVVIGLLLLLKFYLRTNSVPGFVGPFFNHPFICKELLVYVVITVMQEFFMRGVTQTSIEMVLESPHKKFWAILITSCLFGVGHVHLSLAFAGISFAFSLCWGFLYMRHRTIIGICLSHFLIGSFAWMLNFWDYIVL